MESYGDFRALVNEDIYMSVANFKKFFYGIMRNIFVGGYKKVVSEQMPIGQNILFHLGVWQETGFSGFEGCCDLKEIRNVVSSLPIGYKEPFNMHLAGFKYKEIAQRLGVAPAIVRSRITFARQYLQEELSGLA
ncbi:RNA polymerase sigma factor [Bacteroides sp. OttesenSCG-928-J23]|nr:RNA polymerase sigma factor [Bacteroides sp. OttesenSCG-928-J23]MDL2304991.1 RNA polymerase sigma factor [Bacteroides sp. OttesenSCG-928-D19]